MKSIIELAKQAGIPTLLFPDGVEQLSAAHERFAALVRAAALEEFAAAAVDLGYVGSAYADDFVAAIRALKEKA